MSFSKGGYFDMAEIMGFDLSSNLDTKGALRALKMANSNRMYRDNKT